MNLHRPLALDNPQRLKALKKLHTLGLEQNGAFRRMLRLIAKSLSVPTAILSLVDSEQHWIAAQFPVEGDINSQPVLRFSGQVIKTNAHLIVTTRNESPMVTAALANMDKMAAVGIALLTEDAQLLGTLCIFDDVARDWDEEALATLYDFATCLITEIELSVQHSEYQSVKTQLEQERDILRALIDASPDYIFVKDDEGRFVVSNTAHARAAHVDNPDDLVGKTAYDTFAPELAEQFDADDKAVLASGKPLLNLERRTVDYDGNLKWVLTSKVPFVSRDGRVRGLVGISRDISQRKSAEAALHEREQFIEQVLMTSPGFVYVYSFEEQRNIYSNNAISDILGYTPDEIKAMGTSLFSTIMHPDDLTKLMEQVTQSLELDNGEVSQWEYRLKRKDGSFCWVYDRSTIFKRYENGQPLQNIGVVIDITKRKLAEERVQALEQVKTDMIRLAAHDLRNPLTGAIGYAQLLKESLKNSISAQQQSYFEMLSKSLGVMQRIVTDILSLERIESIQQQTEYRTWDFARLVKDVFESRRDDADAHRHDYQLQLPPTPIQVRADEAQLREAIDNLISNAIKYTPDGGNVTVSLTTQGEMAQLIVADSGYGIPDAAQAHIFQPFYRAKTKETRYIEGTGLGLHLVKNIVERHAGHIRFESKVGKGSTFTIDLPLGGSISVHH